LWWLVVVAVVQILEAVAVLVAIGQAQHKLLNLEPLTQLRLVPVAQRELEQLVLLFKEQMVATLFFLPLLLTEVVEVVVAVRPVK
jgi:hypothetical protein